MTADLVMIVPTRGRPGNIRKVISAWDFTNAWDVADLWLAVDADDPEIEGYRELFEQTRHPDTDEPLFQLMEFDEWVPMVTKLDQASLILKDNYFALGFAGDDHIPQTINWAQTYLANLRELKTGLVHGDDGYQGANICTEWAVTADVVRTLGRMIPAPVEHMYSDVSLHDLMTEAGALRYLPQVRIEHMHPIVKKAENDEQYKRVNSREQFARDKASYDGWKNGRKSADLAAIKALQPDRRFPVAARVADRKRTTVTGRTMRSGPTRERTSMSRFPFTKEFKNVRGATPDEIGMTLADFALRVPADQEIVELGVFQGRTALIMAWGAKQGHGAHVTGIDAWDLEGNTYGPPFNEADSENWARYRITELGYADRITLHKNFASDEAAVWSAGVDDARLIGLLFVDDDHDYSGARRAVEDWAPHLADGAVIAVDDYGHPDWPGVKMAVDDLVDEGVLAPVEIYHERLAVTRLTDTGKRQADLQPTAITSEGVSPSPYPAVAGQVAADPVNTVWRSPDIQIYDGSWAEPDADGFTDGSHGGSPHESNDPDQVDTEVSGEEPPLRITVHEGELSGVAEGTSIEDLTIPQLKTLARRRNIILGVRKDKRSEILQALKDGR